MYYMAVVRGGRFVAARAAADRGIPAAFKRELPASRETVIEVGPEHLEKLAAWLAELGQTRQEAPGDDPRYPLMFTGPKLDGFPDGTLLIYSEHPHRGFEQTVASKEGL